MKSSARYFFLIALLLVCVLAAVLVFYLNIQSDYDLTKIFFKHNSLGLNRGGGGNRTNGTYGDGKIVVGVYYETLCPDSIQFIRDQLMPTYQQLKDIMRLDLIPYGKAKHFPDGNGSWRFECQHGQRECFGNMVQSCAINLLNNYDRSLPFIHCMESDRRPDTAGPRCAMERGIDFQPIQNCVNSNQGKDFLLIEGRRTHGLMPKMTFVPWLTINSMHNDAIQNIGLFNLKKVVCDYFEGTKPSACFS